MHATPKRFKLLHTFCINTRILKNRKQSGQQLMARPRGYNFLCSNQTHEGGGRVVRWCWINFQCRGVLLIWIKVGQGPTALAVGAGGVV